MILQAQVAASVAAALGEDFRAFSPRSAAPIKPATQADH
jgi:hypothetical protein